MTPLTLVAALVLCAAGAAKLRSPDAAWHAVAVLGVRIPRWIIRPFAAAELALGLWVAVDPAPVGGLAAAALYVLFAAIGTLLARRHAACGCFGGGDAQASGMQSLLSAVLAAVSLVSATVGSHGAIWLLDQGGYGFVVLIGSGACAYAVVLCYTRLPQAWRAWSAP